MPYGACRKACAVLRVPALDDDRRVAEVRAEQLELQVEHRLEQAGVDASTESGALASQQCRRDSARQVDRRDDVGEAIPDRDRRVVDAAVQPGQAGQRLGKQILSRAILPRSFGRRSR